MSFEDCMNELKERNKLIKYENETFNNKVQFLNVMDELKHHIEKSRLKPRQIYLKKKYGRLYNYFLSYFV